MHCVDTAGRTPEDVAAEIVTLLEDTTVSDQTRIPVDGRHVVRRRRRRRTCSASCRVCSAAGSSGCWSSTRGPCGATGEAVRDDLAAQGFEAFVAEVPDAEEAKTAEVAAFLWGVLGQAGFTRSDAVVGVGGGAVTDLAGFVAATWLRGVAGRARAHHAARHGRRGGRWQDRHQHRRGQEPGRRVPPAGRGAVRPVHAGDVAAQRLRRRAGRGGQVRLHRRPGDPGPRSRPTPRRRRGRTGRRCAS